MPIFFKRCQGTLNLVSLSPRLSLYFDDHLFISVGTCVWHNGTIFLQQ